MKYLLILILTPVFSKAADIKVIYNNSSGFQSEHSESNDSVKFKSFKTANKELTDTKLSKLIDAADASGEHVHGADDVSDFDVEVSNNTDVSANTTARHAAVTVTDSSEIDQTLTGQNITASIVNSSIDESKLDTSVNASLDLADSSSQPGHTHTASNVTDFDTEVSNNPTVAANTADRHVATTVLDSSTIDLSLSGQQVTASVIDNSISNLKLSMMPTLTLKGNNTGTTASANDLNSTQVTAMLNTFTASTDLLDGVKGLVPTPIAGEGSYFLNAGSGWTSIEISNLGSISTDKLLGRISPSTGEIEQVDFSDIGQTIVAASSELNARNAIGAQQDLNNLSLFSITPATDDKILMQDTSGTNQLRYSTVQSIVDMASGMPSGAIAPFAGTTEPSGWLLCYGQAISRTTYAALFSTIGTTYGVGDGSTTFNLPDFRGRVIAGKDNMGGVSANRLTDLTDGIDGDVLGRSGGEEAHLLLSSESGVPAHSHPYQDYYHVNDNVFATGTANRARTLTNASRVTSNNTAADASVAHNNVQPTIIMNYIIKY